ncbi:allantoate deiminase [Lachnotalea glycerini]|uniref:Allantoate deiminase n=2 Tax=Lachnotalea glycerini TaxID=1763509 RepID=A0A318ESR4_9FIRM|nr:Zn-dependent hydrolase [Lachnotalea glycerini]PXV93818.1 allantoate deiminase [Lachnotalea glycerini]
MKVNQNRIFNRLMELGQIGNTEDGVYCLALSPEENEAHALVQKYMEEAGMSVHMDKAGNLVGRKEGTDPNASVVMIGSHLDTVYGGGMFDGRLGVIGGIEAVQVMTEQGIEAKHPIEVLAYRDEEATRFVGSYSGAGHLTGGYDKGIMTHADKDGKTVIECLKECGIDPEHVDEAGLPKGYAKAHLELHIEQGAVLESKNLAVGVVTGICCQIRGEVTINGVASHAGTTPMNLRKDPLAAASEVMLAIESEAKNYQGAVATVGKIEALPGGVNVVPGCVKFSIDMRNQKAALRDEMYEKIKEQAETICKKRNVTIDFNVLMKDAEGKPCAEHIQDKIAKACIDSGLPEFRMPSGAGHDSSTFADFCPMGMIFIRSKDGISHNKVEYSTAEDCAAGTEVLYRTMIELASEEE